MGKTAVIVDSRNVLGQVSAVMGQRHRPTVGGVRASLAMVGFDVSHVHVGLALARDKDINTLAAQHASNDKYKQSIESDPDAEVLLGELHVKNNSDGTTRVEEKIVDGACNVCITKYVDAILHGRSDVESVVVLSKDIDLSPSVDYGLQVGVPVYVAATDVVQRRPHPHLLLTPLLLEVMADLNPAASGHALRELAAMALTEQVAMDWTPRPGKNSGMYTHPTGLEGIAKSSLKSALSGDPVRLYAVDVDFAVASHAGFPVLVLDSKPAAHPPVERLTVVGRSSLLTVKLKGEGNSVMSSSFPAGGVVPGDTVVRHLTTGRLIGRLGAVMSDRAFDPDVIHVIRVAAALPKGGHLGTDASNRRGLILGTGDHKPGARFAAVQIDAKTKGPVWVALGSPLPPGA
ncbi:hypothetical protein ACFVWT_13935 [Arthrobacter sp. NPDC058288]|uniref:hypothetical protein n=1 Tax=Arthrobacter sp. NPDC058288 TaxID=3346424 RepID=UPI0036EF309A